MFRSAEEAVGQCDVKVVEKLDCLADVVLDSLFHTTVSTEVTRLPSDRSYRELPNSGGPCGISVDSQGRHPANE